MESIETLFARLEGAFAPNTLRAYRADFRVFERWCNERDLRPMAVTPEAFADFITCTAQDRSSATVRRYVKSLDTVFRLSGLEAPGEQPEAALALRRVFRQKGRAQAQAIPLTADVLLQLLAVCEQNPSGLRDQVMLRLGYESLRRRAELCRFRFDDIERRHDGRAAIHLRFSKADQEGRGRLIPLSPELDDLLKRWHREAPGHGYILRPMARLDSGECPLHPATVNRRLRHLQAAAGLELGSWLTGHSFRVGAALDLLEAGVPLEKIMLRGGWSSESSVIRYLRAWEWAV